MNGGLPLSLRRKVYHQCALPVTTDRTETWGLTSKQDRGLTSKHVKTGPRSSQRAHFALRHRKRASWIREQTNSGGKDRGKKGGRETRRAGGNQCDAPRPCGCYPGRPRCAGRQAEILALSDSPAFPFSRWCLPTSLPPAVFGKRPPPFVNHASQARQCRC